MQSLGNSRLYFLAASAFSISFLCYLTVLPLDRLGTDRYAFWAASLAYNNSINPYDAEAVLAQARSVDRSLEFSEIELVWAPPIVFSFISIYSAFNFSYFCIYLLIVSLLSFLLAQFVVYKFLGDPKSMLLGLIFFCSFMPFLDTLHGAPLIPYCLAALSGYLYLKFINKNLNLSLEFLSGMLLSVTLLKPHLVAILFLYVLLNSIKTKNFICVVGIGAGLLLLVLPSFLHFPQVWTLWFENLTKPQTEHLTPLPLNYLTPTISSWMTNYFGLTTNYKFTSTVLVGLTYTFWYTGNSKRYSGLTHALIAISLSILAAPYLWPYDFTILLFPVAIALTRPMAEVIVKRIHYYYYSAGLMLIAILFLYSTTYPRYVVWYPILFGTGSIAFLIKNERITSDA